MGRKESSSISEHARSMKFLTSNVKYYDGGYEAFDSLLHRIVEDVIVSLIMSGLFVLAV